MNNNIKEPTKKDLFDMVVRLLNREDQLINSRMTWYLTIQGFIIAAVALIFTGKLEDYQNLRTPVIRLLSFLGISISFVVFISVLRARKAKKITGSKWKKSVSKTGKNDPFPDPRGDISWLSIFTPGQSVPWIIIVFWVIIYYYAKV